MDGSIMKLLLVDWDMKLQQTMVEMFPLNSADAAYNKISGMLSTLGDPFTRIISPKVLQLTLVSLFRISFSLTLLIVRKNYNAYLCIF